MSIHKPQLRDNDIGRDIGRRHRHDISEGDDDHQYLLSVKFYVDQRVGKQSRVHQHNGGRNNRGIAAVPHILIKHPIRQRILIIHPLCRLGHKLRRHLPDLILRLDRIGQHPQKWECDDDTRCRKTYMDPDMLPFYLFSSHTTTPIHSILNSLMPFSRSMTAAP